MRIGLSFFTFDPYLSGVEYYFLGLLRALLKLRSNDTFVLFTNQLHLLDHDLKKCPNLIPVEIRHLTSRTRRILWEHMILPRKIKEHQVDLLHCPSYICPLRRVGIPYVVTIHDTIAIDYPQFCKRTNALYYGLFMRRTVSTAAGIVAVSASTRNDITRLFGVNTAKLHLIYPGIDSRFRVARDEEGLSRVKERCRLPDHFILYVGNIEHKKNIATLLAVIERLRARGVRQKMVIVGKRAWRTHTELKRIRKLEDSGDIVMTGYVPRADLPAVYQLADCFVFPSFYEGFGFPPLEAMACGVPVVASDRGALKETLGDAACLVEPDDAEGIAEGICALVKDRALRASLIDRGLDRVRQFSWAQAAQETLALYREIAGRCA